MSRYCFFFLLLKLNIQQMRGTKITHACDLAPQNKMTSMCIRHIYKTYGHAFCWQFLQNSCDCCPKKLQQGRILVLNVMQATCSHDLAFLSDVYSQIHQISWTEHHNILHTCDIQQKIAIPCFNVLMKRQLKIQTFALQTQRNIFSSNFSSTRIQKCCSLVFANRLLNGHKTILTLFVCKFTHFSSPLMLSVSPSDPWLVYIWRWT